MSVSADSVQSLHGALSSSIDAALRNAYFALPGIVESFDAGVARARVRPALDRVVSGVGREHPVVLDVPVVYPSGGGYGLTFPLVAGDDVLLLFSQRGLTDWKSRLGSGLPRRRSVPDRGAFLRLNDALALPGFVRGDVRSGLDFRVPAAGAVMFNGRPGFSTVGPLIATATLGTGTTTGGVGLTPVQSLTLAPDAAGFATDGLALQMSSTTPWPLAAYGLMVLSLSSTGVIGRTVFLPGVIGDVRAATSSERRLLYIRGDRPDADSNRIEAVRQFGGVSAGDTFDSRILFRWESGDIPAGVALEIRWAWNGGPWDLTSSLVS